MLSPSKENGMASREDVLPEWTSGPSSWTSSTHMAMQKRPPRSCIRRHRACPPSLTQLHPQGKGLRGGAPETTFYVLISVLVLLFNGRGREMGVKGLSKEQLRIFLGGKHC